jgi:hypothetical protein
VSTSKQGSELVVDQFTGNLDANGNFTGATDKSSTRGLRRAPSR